MNQVCWWKYDLSVIKKNMCLSAYLITGDDSVRIETEPFNGLMVSPPKKTTSIS